MSNLTCYDSVSHLLEQRQPTSPVYCIYPDIYLQATQSFVARFPGRVLFAVKANDDPQVISLLHRGGVNHFDCASLDEIARVKAHCPSATCYFMVPVRLRGAARTAQRQFGVRHFIVDHPRGLALLTEEIDTARAVIFARLAVHHDSALQDLSSKFGGEPAIIPDLLAAIKDCGAEPALAFNVGSSVIDPRAYAHAIDVAAGVLGQIDFRIRLVDVGGGFPRSYPGFAVPPLDSYFDLIAKARERLPMAPNGELMGEPGRALAAPGMSALVEVLLRKNDRLYINDGMYGIFWELRFKGHDRYPVRAYRGAELLGGATKAYALYGPTCDATDVLPGRVSLPESIREGDYLEFGHIGAYSLAGRTRFNGLYSDDIVQVTGVGQAPPSRGIENAVASNEKDN